MEFDRQLFAAALESLRCQATAKQKSNNSNGENKQLAFSLHLFETLPSTNQKLWELLDQGATSGTVAIAIEQKTGRGQWGRQWHSPPGGLYLSLALAPHLPAEHAPQLTICGAWGIGTILREYDLPVWLKWPNDIVLSERKLGGILTETRVKQGCITKAVVGVGINLNNPVPENGINLQTFLLNNPSPLLSLEMLAAVILQGLASGYQYWQQHGINNLLPSYQNLLINIGQKVEIEGNPATVVGVSANGDLRVRLLPKGSEPPLEISLQPGTISLGYG
ncbi:MAG TPA: biotin--[acetyl-CoA-carboxylase] ligase [Leptolyngbyaceae cyanobacterium]